MSVQDQNKALTRRIPLEVIDQGKLELLDELVAPDYKDHTLTASGTATGREALREFIKQIRATFPDHTTSLDDEIAEGDLVVHRATVTGTMRGPFQGMPPTGKRATWSEMHILRLRGGKVVEHWAEVDQVSMLQQLGLMPAAAPRQD